MTDLERKQKLQRIINAYHRVSALKEFAIVLDDIRECFGLDRPAFLPLEDKPTIYDSHYAAVRDGQRSVLLHVEARLKAPVMGDNELPDKPKVRSKKKTL